MKKIKLKCHNCGLKMSSGPLLSLNITTSIRERFEKDGWWKDHQYDHWYCPHCMEKFKKFLEVTE